MAVTVDDIFGTPSADPAEIEARAAFEVEFKRRLGEVARAFAEFFDDPDSTLGANPTDVPLQRFGLLLDSAVATIRTAPLRGTRERLEAEMAALEPMER
jgi:hypothetical protein